MERVVRVASSVSIIVDIALACGCESKRSGIQIFNATNGAELQLLPTTPADDDINLAALSPDGSVVAVAGRNRDLEVWKVHTGELVYRIKSATSWNVNSIAISPKTDTFAVGGSKGWVELRKLSTGQVVKTLRTAATIRVTSVAFSPDGETLAICGVRWGGRGFYSYAAMESLHRQRPHDGQPPCRRRQRGRLLPRWRDAGDRRANDCH